MEFEYYRKKLNRYFESAFINNDFETLFPYVVEKSYKENIINYWDEMLKDNPEEYKELSPLILDNIETFLCSLPFFQMVFQFKFELLEFIWTKPDHRGVAPRYKFNRFDHIFAIAMMNLSSRDFGLSSEFYNRYFTSSEQYDYYSYFKVSVVKKVSKEGGRSEIVEASNWFKLVCHLTQEAKAPANYKSIISNICSDVVTPKHNNHLGCRKDSFFHYFINRDNGGFRAWVEQKLANNLHINEFSCSNDYWTKCILATLKK